MPIVSRSKFTKVYRGKNGYTSTFAKSKANGKAKWTRIGGSKPRSKKKK